MNKKTDFVLTCGTCKGTWMRRSENLPKQCPKCGDRHWNKDTKK